MTVSTAAAAERALAPHTIEIDGITRSYHLHVPSAVGPTPAPLVLVFHGGGGTGPGTERLTRFTALADREGFLVAFPEGVEKNWNDGREFTSSRAHRDHVDDVAFVAVLIDAIGRAHAVDPRRVYATGISNGGIFSHYLAAHLSARIAAIAPVVGGIADPPDAWLRPEQPVSVLMLQGTRDPLVPYHGGAVAFGRGKIIDTEEAARRWAALNGGREPVREPLPADGKDRCGGLRTIYPGGRDGSEVTLVRLDGGGHTWPGGAQYLPELLIGRVCRDFDATVLIWDFFKTHPKPGGP
ncbi:MAG TPA: PHB depolymerase family esterase [Candidatus Dormibacteraeota bacterium]|nr:PHB depolymerase family esterase [Candidatus Dormibacteraeota bacterium]